VKTPEEQETPFVPRATDEESPVTDVQPKTEEPYWLLVGYGSGGIDDLKQYALNPRSADVKVTDIPEIPCCGVDLPRSVESEGAFPCDFHPPLSGRSVLRRRGRHDALCR
jgi:hypothetical protein